MLSLAWSVVLLVILVSTRATVALRATAEAFASSMPSALLVPATAIVYLALVMAINEIVDMPVAFYSGFTLEQRYGLSNEGITAWLSDHAKSLAIGFALSAAAAAVVYGLIAWSPDWWWLIAAAVFAGVFVGLTQVAPVVVLPLFYRVKPIEQDSLRTRLLALADRAGAQVLGVYEWGLGDKTRKANAALAGLGATRRILVSDTMLAQYSEEEIEVVLAHELAHHVHGDIWKGIAFETVLIVAGFYAAARALAGFSSSIGLRSPADVAGLPLLLLAAGAVSLATVPFAHALSRTYERRADRFALNLTRNPQAFISAMRRLGAQNLAEEEPSKIVQWLFYSHPPIRERIDAAQAFRTATSASPARARSVGQSG
jgi:STE24 endopeptidase